MLAFLTLLLTSFLHPFYVSITDVSYNPKSNQLEMVARIFYDDLENALQNDGLGQVDLINPKQKAHVDSLLGIYLQRHLKVAIDGQIIPTTYVGYQINEDVAACYLAATTPLPRKTIELKNDLLYHRFDKQTNILHVKIGNLKKSTKLDNPQSLFKITL